MRAPCLYSCSIHVIVTKCDHKNTQNRFARRLVAQRAISGGWLGDQVRGVGGGTFLITVGRQVGRYPERPVGRFGSCRSAVGLDDMYRTAARRGGAQAAARTSDLRTIFVSHKFSRDTHTHFACALSNCWPPEQSSGSQTTRRRQRFPWAGARERAARGVSGVECWRGQGREREPAPTDETDYQ